jgi:hypothetical protein
MGGGQTQKVVQCGGPKTSGVWVTGEVKAVTLLGAEGREDLSALGLLTEFCPSWA